MTKQFDLTEYNKLKELLDKYEIPYEENTDTDGESTADKHFLDYIHTAYGLPYEFRQLIYPCRDEQKRKSDVVLSWNSYGGADGLLEQMGLLPDPNGDLVDGDVEGWLDAQTVFERWAEDFGYFVKGLNLAK